MWSSAVRHGAPFVEYNTATATAAAPSLTAGPDSAMGVARLAAP